MVWSEAANACVVAVAVFMFVAVCMHLNFYPSPPPRQVGVVTSTLNGERSRLSASKTRACETIGASAWQAWFGE